MNLVGKIFTVLIFVMSLVFMAFAVAVYATHKNWQEEAGQLAKKLQTSEARNEKLSDEKTNLEGDLATEKTAAVQVRSRLETELDVLQEEHKKLQQRRAALVESERKALAEMNTAQARLTALEKEEATLRTDLIQARKDKDANFKVVLQRTDELHNAVAELKRLKRRQQELAADHAKALAALRREGIKLVDKPNPPKNVHGIVRAVRGDGLVEIDLGKDDGLLKGHRLELSRGRGTGSVYVGRIEVVQTFPDKAVCKTDPKFLNSKPQEGDRVSSSL